MWGMWTGLLWWIEMFSLRNVIWSVHSHTHTHRSVQSHILKTGRHLCTHTSTRKAYRHVQPVHNDISRLHLQNPSTWQYLISVVTTAIRASCILHNYAYSTLSTASHNLKLVKRSSWMHTHWLRQLTEWMRDESLQPRDESLQPRRHTDLHTHVHIRTHTYTHICCHWKSSIAQVIWHTHWSHLSPT